MSLAVTMPLTVEATGMREGHSMDLRRMTIILGLWGFPLLTGCVVLPIDGGSTTTTVQTFEAGGDLQGRGVGFAGYFSRPSQPGLFVQLQSVRDGAVGGAELSQLPSGPLDPEVAREQLGWSVAAGTTWEAEERWTLYGGLGLAYTETWIERFDGTLSTGDNGYYHTSTGDDLSLEATVGALWNPTENWVIDFGYSTFSEAIFVGLGYSGP